VGFTYKAKGIFCSNKDEFLKRTLILVNMFKRVLLLPLLLSCFLVEGFTSEISANAMRQMDGSWFRESAISVQEKSEKTVNPYSGYGTEDSVLQLSFTNMREDPLLEVPEQEPEQLLPCQKVYSPDEQTIVYVEGDDLWCHSIINDERIILLQQKQGIRDPQFITKTVIGFSIQEDLYRLNLTTHVLKRVGSSLKSKKTARKQEDLSEN
jgi:hypothetical protein